MPCLSRLAGLLLVSIAAAHDTMNDEPSVMAGGDDGSVTPWPNEGGYYGTPDLPPPMLVSLLDGETVHDSTERLLREMFGDDEAKKDKLRTFVLGGVENMVATSKTTVMAPREGHPVDENPYTANDITWTTTVTLVPPEPAIEPATMQRNPLYSIPIVFNDDPCFVHHFEGADPVDEARAFVEAMVIPDPMLGDSVVEYIARIIESVLDFPHKRDELRYIVVPMSKRTMQDGLPAVQGGNGISASDETTSDDPSSGVQIDTVVDDSATARQVKDTHHDDRHDSPLFSVPVIINNNPVYVPHFEGANPVDEARAFVLSTETIVPSFREGMVAAIAKLIESVLESPEKLNFMDQYVEASVETMRKYEQTRLGLDDVVASAEPTATTTPVKEHARSDQSIDDIKAMAANEATLDDAANGNHDRGADPMFSIPLFFNSEPVFVHHFAGADPVDEAVALVDSMDMSASTFRNDMVASIAEMIESFVESPHMLESAPHHARMERYHLTRRPRRRHVEVIAM
ncbi:Aste57867_22535 [Aphanomyces stellatus]|uniref:Aste57867_22535 protein n=1 Tax=Aphanomyces stellatus TaxID=120398 RepID=A0A485LM05_9STRA|nr:hypothetical protein As57867_022465 [Aphanomyces stellatus]VFT99195.1 Aste57867_22535 [Aphanomyces stellatus]